jgi:glycosyltransferase involved in cell wall biosynthesis
MAGLFRTYSTVDTLSGEIIIMTSPFLSVVIPAYNEETNIRLGSLEKVSRYLNRQSYAWEVILVDDGSTDETVKLLLEFVKDNQGFSCLQNTHQGKAATVIAGVRQAKGKFVLFSDLDQATPIVEIEKLLPWFEKGYDVVIGSRNRNRQGAPLSRIIMARGFMFLRSMVLGLHGITDTQCGFKAFRREVAKEIFQKLELYGTQHAVEGPMVTAGFDIELLYLAKKLGYKIKEVPVEWHYVETRRVSPIKDSLQGFFDIMRIRLNALRGKYR